MNMTATVQKQTTSQMITGFREEMQMTEKDWHKFCLRYATRDISTVILFFEGIFCSLPYGFKSVLREELKKEAQYS